MQVRKDAEISCVSSGKSEFYREKHFCKDKKQVKKAGPFQPYDARSTLSLPMQMDPIQGTEQWDRDALALVWTPFGPGQR